jgi:hypothetical protein
MTDTIKAATISACGRYRYDLTRRWDEGPLALWIMLNPSTADAEVDDPTIRRVAGFSRSWGMPGFTVVNLYALRATKPAHLLAADDPTGPDNGYTIRAHILTAAVIVGAWGAWWSSQRDRPPRYNVEGAVRDAGRRLYCLGTTKGGEPRHPLYVAASQPRVPFGGRT